LVVELDDSRRGAYRLAMIEPSPFWRRVKTLVVELLAGLALGVLAWEAVGRRILSFKYGSLGSSVTCAPDVDRALADFDSGLRLSALVSAVAFTAVAVTVRFWWRRRRAARATQKT
jgi:hypothetical protein